MSQNLDLIPIRRALISVSDKAGLVDFGRALAARGVELLSTGGSAARLRAAGVAVTEVADATGFPEMLDGRVKTLHPVLHGGILGRRDLPAHVAAMAAHKMAPIDLVVVNLYPFAATVAGGADFATCVENIDIGGPALLRAAAKNHDFVAAVCRPGDYEALLAELAAHDGALTLTTRRRLAETAFAHTGAYDAEVAAWFARGRGEVFPEQMTLSGRRTLALRYGENPHQVGALYVDTGARAGVATARQLQGKELSYNNLNDTDAAFELAAEFEAPAIAIIKHANPCGVATAATLTEAYRAALACDSVSAFGGIIAANRPLDAATAEEIAKLFVEVVIAPAVDDAALAVLGRKKNVRVLVTGSMPDASGPGVTLRTVAGGFLAQTRDGVQVTEAALKVVTRRAPTAAELADLLFAVRVVKHAKSNAIIYARGGATVAIGAGQTSRVDAARFAVARARELAAAGGGEGGGPTAGSVVASDAFFPFPDGLLVAAEAGATAAIQPGGSVRDAEVIAAADQHNMAMVFTGVRHFRH